MNREQRRAKLKQLGRHFDGFDITTGIIELPIKGTDKKLKLDLYDFETIATLSDMVYNFQNSASIYPEEYKATQEEKDPSKLLHAQVMYYRKIIASFSESINHLFGANAVVDIFGNKTPMPQVIAEFLDDFIPIVEVIKTINDDNPQSTQNPQLLNYSADRIGNV